MGLTDVVKNSRVDAMRSQRRVCYDTLARKAIEAWHAAVSTPLHAPGCGCCGGGAVKLDPNWLAEDIDSALRTRYAAAGLESLIAILDAHRLAAGGDFAGRLSGLANHEDHEQDGAAMRILCDVIDMLQTIGRPSPGLR